MGTIESGTLSIMSGNCSIDITHGSLSNDVVKVENIGSIEAEFDIENNDEDASNVLFSLGNFTCTVFNDMDSGNSFFDAIDALSSTDKIEITLTFTDNSGATSTNPFEFTKNEVNYDYLGRRVTIDAKFNYSPTTIVTTVLSDNCNDVELVGGYDESNESSAPLCGMTPSTGEIHGLPAKVFVEDMLAKMNTGNTVINDSFLYQTNPTVYVLASDGGTTSNTGSDPAIDLFYRMAVSDGAIVGSFLGYNFFVSRQKTNNAVELSESDVERIEISPSYDDYLNIRHVFGSILDLSMKNTAAREGVFFYDSLFGTAEGLNDRASKITNIYFQTNKLAKVIFDGSDWLDDSRTLFTSTSINLDGDAKEGDFRIKVSTVTGASVGDYIFPSARYEQSYKIESITSPFIYLEEPIRQDIDDGTNMQIFNDMDTFESDAAGNTVNNYALAYNAIGTRKVSFTVLGVDKVKPYQSVTFATAFDTIGGQTFRPSKISYNLEADKIMIEGYQI